MHAPPLDAGSALAVAFELLFATNPSSVVVSYLVSKVIPTLDEGS
jgi:hypothetical protein